MHPKLHVLAIIKDVKQKIMHSRLYISSVLKKNWPCASSLHLRCIAKKLACGAKVDHKGRGCVEKIQRSGMELYIKNVKKRYIVHILILCTYGALERVWSTVSLICIEEKNEMPAKLAKVQRCGAAYFQIEDLMENNIAFSPSWFRHLVQSRMEPNDNRFNWKGLTLNKLHRCNRTQEKNSRYS